MGISSLTNITKGSEVRSRKSEVNLLRTSDFGLRSSFLTLLLLLLVQAAGAQILNIERYRVDKDTADFWTGNITIGGSAKKQLINVYTFNASSNVVYLSERHSYLNINSIRFIRIGANSIISEGFTHWRLNLFRRKPVNLEPFFQYQYDLGRGMKRRELYGVSFRRSLRKSENLVIAVATGAMYEHERWEGNVLRFPLDAERSLAEVHFVKSTSNFLIRGKLAKDLSLFAITYYQARFEDFFNPRVITDLHLVYNLSKYFSISQQFVSTFDAAPILQDNEFIFTYTTNLVIKW